MARYICTGKTYQFPKLYRIGDIYNGSPDGLPKDKNGEIRGFRLLEGDPPAKPATHVAVKVNEKVAGETETAEEPASTKATELPQTPRPKKLGIRRRKKS